MISLTVDHLKYSAACILSQLAVYGVRKEWDEMVFNQEGQACTGGLLLRAFCFPVLSFHMTVSNALAVLLKHLLKDHGLCVHIFLQLKEQLCQADQTHRSELEGMKKEISRLTQELHQRDITIASANGSTSDLEQQLRTEIERAERKAVEHRVKNSSAVSLMEQRAWNTALHFLAMLSFFLSATFKQRL